MKAFSNSIYIVVIIALLTLTACSSDDKNTNPSSSVSEFLTQGSWKITLFQEDSKNETYYFTGYDFVFNQNGSAVASNNSTTKNGSWNTGSDDSQNKLYLDFGQEDPFEELTDDWIILENTSSKIRLQHTSGGDGSIDLLTFERN